MANTVGLRERRGPRQRQTSSSMSFRPDRRSVQRPLIADLASMGSLAGVREALERGVDINQPDRDGCTALHLAVSEGYRDVAVLLIQHGADMGLRDSNGFSLLHWATFSNDPVLLDLAYVGGIGLDCVDNDSRTPLSWAISEDSAMAIDWLLERGANPNVGDRDGWLPLHYAAATGAVESIEKLLRAGVSASVVSVLNETAKDVAQRLRHWEAAIALRS
jgi:ankyrin repeat protein